MHKAAPQSSRKTTIQPKMNIQRMRQQMILKILIRMMAKISRRPSFHRRMEGANIQREAGMTDSSIAPWKGRYEGQARVCIVLRVLWSWS